MRPYHSKQFEYKLAPTWAENSSPKRVLKRTHPSLLLLRLPEEDNWQVASLAESNAVADPNSFLGRLLRAHCALLSLPYVSEN
jgi:hypothetical protein